MTPNAGTTVADKYLLEAPLAGGGMGSLWAARRFEREAKAVAQLRSPHVVHGVNDGANFEAEHEGFGLLRMGGNRLTAYNWENNASNAGSDWQFSNDGYLSDSSTPGEAVRIPTKNALDHGAAMLVTVPIAGYVSADKVGRSIPMPRPRKTRTFTQSSPRKAVRSATARCAPRPATSKKPRSMPR